MSSLSKQKEKLNKIMVEAFHSSLGQQLEALYTTSDLRVFIRASAAIAYAESQILADNRILTHYREDYPKNLLKKGNKTKMIKY